MKNIREIFNLPKTSGTFGIEIEVEGEDLKMAGHSIYWTDHNDGSLRGRYPDQSHEYVLGKPIALKNVKPALTELTTLLKDSKLEFSFRTSVHVHYNVQSLTESEVLNIIYTYCLIEPALINFCGEERINNRFCLRIRDAEGIYKYLSDLFSNGIKDILNFDQNGIRYSALNLAALYKYGSIEFRGMRGTLDVDTLITWINAIQSIKNFASKFESVKDIYNEFAKSTPIEFLKKVLKDAADSFIFPGVEDEMNLSFSLCIDLPFAFQARRPVKEKEMFIEPIRRVRMPASIHIDAYFPQILNN